jgi:hypothetical protein
MLVGQPTQRRQSKKSVCVNNHKSPQAVRDTRETEPTFCLDTIQQNQVTTFDKDPDVISEQRHHSVSRDG